MDRVIVSTNEQRRSEQGRSGTVSPGRIPAGAPALLAAKFTACHRVPSRSLREGADMAHNSIKTAHPRIRQLITTGRYWARPRLSSTGKYGPTRTFSTYVEARQDPSRWSVTTAGCSMSPAVT